MGGMDGWMVSSVLSANATEMMFFSYRVITNKTYFGLKYRFRQASLQIKNVTRKKQKRRKKFKKEEKSVTMTSIQYRQQLKDHLSRGYLLLKEDFLDIPVLFPNFGNYSNFQPHFQYHIKTYMSISLQQDFLTSHKDGLSADF